MEAIPQGGQLKQLKTDLPKNSKAVLKRFKTAKDFAKEFNLDNCMERYCCVKTHSDGLLSNKVKLNELSACYGEENICNWIAAWLITVSLYMNFEISTQQVKITSILILEEMYMINIAEFSFFFRKLIKGAYRPFYGKFNGQTIIQACKEFRHERGRVFSQMPSDLQNQLI